jgi:hypothetical protein
LSNKLAEDATLSFLFSYRATGGSDVMINHVLACRRNLSTMVFTWSTATGDDGVAHRVSCRKATLANLGRCRAPPAGLGRARSLCKHGGKRKVPMNEVLTATLQAVRMSTLWANHTDPAVQRLHM